MNDIKKKIKKNLVDKVWQISEFSAADDVSVKPAGFSYCIHGTITTQLRMF